jgi:hypothetical protein
MIVHAFPFQFKFSLKNIKVQAGGEFRLKFDFSKPRGLKIGDN